MPAVEDATASVRRFEIQGYMGLYSDAFSGIASCGALVVRLEGGPHYVEVSESGNDATIDRYVLEVKASAEVGADPDSGEVVNDSIATAIPLVGSDVHFVGSAKAAFPAYFAISVPNGGSIRAEVLEGHPVPVSEYQSSMYADIPAICASPIGGALTLFDSAGRELVADRADGRGSCPQIDGTGGAALKDTAAGNLAEGTYYVRVSDYFSYTLHVVIRPTACSTRSCAGLPDGASCGPSGHCCGGVCGSNFDTAHCGTSCVPCPERQNSYATCNGSACGVACSPKLFSFTNTSESRLWADCDGEASNGCETDLYNDAYKCGSCTCSCGRQRTPFCENGFCFEATGDPRCTW